MEDKVLKKVPTGIAGFDEITYGGLPQGRPSLICGSAGCGKTLFSLEFLVRGATQYNEPGVFIAFEESKEDLIKNVASLGFDLQSLIDEQKIYIDYLYIDPNEIHETGEYDLEGLFIRLNTAIEKVGAKRVAIDTIEVLYSTFKQHNILRSEINRLFKWLREKGLTTIITGEKGEKTLTRHGLEEYVSDCVIALDHVMLDKIYTRRLRIVKYRGSTHHTNDFPFLIDETGISILPITSLSLNHKVSEERISSGIPKLDDMLEGKGFYRGSSILLSGTAGTGKSSLCATITNACCQNGEKVLYMSFEESKFQLIRNFKSIGLNLKEWEEKGLLQFYSERTTAYGLENHLTRIHKLINEFKPGLVVIDPISSFMTQNNHLESTALLTRLIDFIKSQQITALFTNLTKQGGDLETSNSDISSIIDAWILLRDIEINGERNRGIYILKARGMKNSNQIREFLITSEGLDIREVYIGSGGVLTGSTRIAQENADNKIVNNLNEKIDQVTAELARKKKENTAREQLLALQNESGLLEIEQTLTNLKQQIEEIRSGDSKVAASRKS